ncbi:MAG: GNAT family N-acetyltransferase [Sediminibacterium sp.]|nr:GNAT family N-acetyltransferase [Sediminibacterium sp.]
MFDIKIIPYKSPEYFLQVHFRYRLLRKPLGLTFSRNELLNESNDIFIAGYIDSMMMSCCILSPLSISEIKLRQMAIDTSFQQNGYGKKIIQFAENYIQIQSHYRYITLNARADATSFYEKCGYTKHEPSFIEVSIVHYKMSKNI